MEHTESRGGNIVTEYKFPEGTWKIEDYRSARARSDEFTGNYRLMLEPKDPNEPGGPHYGAITVNCDNREFIDRLLEFLNG